MKTLTAELRIMRQIIIDSGVDPVPSLEDEEAIQEAWEKLDEEGMIQDSKYEFRSSGELSKVPCEFSRHYESDSVAKKLNDGSWVGWTYWHGGGKHGDPDGIEWLSEAYDLDVQEEEKLVIVRTFSKKA